LEPRERDIGDILGNENGLSPPTDDLIFDVENEFLADQIRFEAFCMRMSKNVEDVQQSLRKYHLHLQEKEQYPKSKKALFAGFEKWFLNEKNFAYGRSQETKSGEPKLGTSAARVKKASEW
jgi:hypothetical protein